MARPITETLRAIAGGEFMDEISDQMSQLVIKVDETGKKGSLVIEIDVKLAVRGGAMSVIGKSKLKLPASDPAECLMFATPEGNLVSDNPRQKKLDLKSIEETDKSLKEIAK